MENSLWFIVYGVKKYVSSQLPDSLRSRSGSVVSCWRSRVGFTLIELLIVVSLLGVSGAILSSAYLSFEGRDRVKRAALDLKSNLRLAQNKALTGDKGFGSGVSCGADDDLIGWFIRIDTTASSDSYVIAGDCKINSTIKEIFSPKTIKLPDQVSITSVEYDGVSSDIDLTGSSVDILFRPFGLQTYFFNSANTPPFTILSDSEEPNNETKLINSSASDQISLKLQFKFKNDAPSYEVVVSTTGEVSEKKI